MDKKIAIITPAYKDEALITACVEQFKPFGLPHLVLLSTKPWGGGTPREEDLTGTLAKKAGAQVIAQYWEDEIAHRNFGLAYFHDYDYVITVDVDELFTQDDINSLIGILNTEDESCFRAPKMKTYWKTPEYQFRPGDKHEPVIAVNPKECKFYDAREVRKIAGDEVVQWRPIIPIQMHHFSFVRTDSRIHEKLDIFKDIENLKEGWFDNIWLKWKPGDKTDIRLYGKEKSEIVYDPAPKEIQELYERSVNSQKT